MQKKWTKEEIKQLILHYNKINKDELTKLLGRSWSSIQNKAFLLGIKRFYNSVDKLIDKSIESYYWLGFIMADGHFSKNKVLQINLGEKDFEHLKLLNKFLGRTLELTIPRLSVPINSIWDELVSNYNISSRKTYNPCSINSLKGDSLFAFVVGFIDGDGSIDKKGGIRVKCHKSWYNNLNIMFKSIAGNYFYNCYLTKEGLALATLGSVECTKKIKKHAIKLKLPILERKWNRILESRLSKNEIKIKNKRNCYMLFNDNKTIKEVIKKTGLSQSQVYKQYSEYRESIKEKDLKRELSNNQ